MKQITKNKIVIIISGPTASGKTSTSINLAKKLKKNYELNTEIVNFDSLLFYKELNIGTAKPTSKERSEVKHHLINIKSAKKSINASNFIELATQKIDELHKENIAVILVGGSGFYLRALIKGMYDSATLDPDLKKSNKEHYIKEGITFFRQRLKSIDEESYDQIHENDHYRIIRAYEHFENTGEKLSDQKKKFDKLDPYDFKNNIHPSWNIFHCFLDIDKPTHQKIIKKRAQNMLKDGLVNEVKELIKMGFTGNEKPLQSIGYKETFDYLNNKFKSIDEYLERIIISTRQLAKAQRTFFKKIKTKNCYNPLEETDNIYQDLLNFLSSN